VNTIDLELQEQDGAHSSLAVPYETTESVHDVLQRLDRAGELERSAALDAALSTIQGLDDKRPLADIIWPARPIRVQRVCVDLHFETEAKQAQFPAQAKWARVHRWGCHAFKIASDACAHLELHEGSPTGPALNERQAIGVHTGCKTVWLVKPGPEPNG
jgi:hypothetical protein